MPTPRIEEIVDSVMGLIIQNSVGLIHSDKPNDYGYANGVYLNNIKAELPSILTEAHQAGIDEAVELVNKHDPMANKKSNPNYWGNTLRKALKALQDNK